MRNFNTSNGIYSASQIRKMRYNLKRGDRLRESGDEREGRAFHILQQEIAGAEKEKPAPPE